MNIITLNTWGGRGGREALLEFFRTQRDTTDLFCLQEIWSERYDDFEADLAGGVKLDHSKIMTYALQDIGEIVSDFTPYFRPHFRDSYGLCIFVRNNLEVVDEGEVFVHKHKGYEPVGDIRRHARNIQFVTIQTESGLKTIINFHGLWNGMGKSDTEERLAQSDKIIEFIQTVSNPVVLCGDFNLTPDTESLKRIERAGLRNLITEYGITSTRTNFYTKPEKFADYVFVSDGITVNDLSVLPDEVSDHAPILIQVA